MKSTQTAAPAQKQETKPTTEHSASSKPEFILKVKDGDKFVRIGGMWKTDKGDGFKITLDDGVEITSTEKDRFKCFAFLNNYEEKFGKDGKK